MTTELAQVNALTLLDGAADIQVERTGVLTFEISIMSPAFGRLKVQVNAINVIHTHAAGQISDQQIVDLPVALMDLDNGLVRMNPYGGVEATLRLPASLLEREHAGGSLLQQARNVIPGAPIYDVHDQLSFCGEMYDTTICRTDKPSVFILRVTNINVADRITQRPGERIYVFDPTWQGKDPHYYGGEDPLNDIFKSRGALAHLQDQVARTERVAAEITKLFRDMTPDKPPTVSAELRKELELLGKGALESWQAGALAGRGGAVGQLTGCQADLMVGLLMREDHGSPGVSHRQIKPGICCLPSRTVAALLQLIGSPPTAASLQLSDT